MKKYSVVLFVIIIFAVISAFQADAVVSSYDERPYRSDLRTLDAPKNLRWYGSCARWDTVVNATSYSITLCVSGSDALVTTVTSTVPAYDFRNTFKSLTSQTDYYFIVWAVSSTGETPLFNNSSAVRSGVKAVTPDDVKGLVTLNISTYGAGGVERSMLSINGAEPVSVNSGLTDSFFKGTEISIEYVPKAGSKFLFWKNNATNKILSYNPAYSFKLGSNTHIVAYIIKDNDLATTGTHFYIFEEFNGYVVRAQGALHGSSITPPTSLLRSFIGYTFTGWDNDGYLCLTRDIIVKALYKQNPETYRLSVVYQGNENNPVITTHTFDKKVTVALDRSKIPTGKFFGGWSLNNGKSIISYEESYSFYIGGNTTLTAVISDTPVTPVPSVTVTLAGATTSYVSFLESRTVPAGYSLVEAGVIYTANSTVANSGAFDLSSVDNSSVKSSIAGKTATSNQFLMTVYASGGKTVYCVGYLMYADSSGNVGTVYSSIVNQMVYRSIDLATLGVNVYNEGIVYRNYTDPGSKSYNAWPTVARLDNGKIAVGFSGNRFAHICIYGQSLLSVADESDLVFEAPRVMGDLTLDCRDTGILNIGGGKVFFGWLVMPKNYYQVTNYNRIINYFDYYKSYDLKQETIDTIASYSSMTADELLCGSLYRLSSDNGATFGEIKSVPVNSPHGPTKLRDGSLFYLGKVLFNTAHPDYLRMVAYRSINGGESWYQAGSAVPLPENTTRSNFHEAYAVELPDGTIVGILRGESLNADYFEYPDLTMFITYSRDGGKSWSLPVCMNTNGAPPHLMVHSSGALICTFGRRQSPFGIRAIISYDGGNSWSPEFTLASGESTDLGYPSSVELSDGKILTVYYKRYVNSEKPSIMYTTWDIVAP